MFAVALGACAAGWISVPRPGLSSAVGTAHALALPSRVAHVHATESAEADQPWYSRLAEGYSEGYERARASFATPRPGEAVDPNAGPLRRSDKLAGLLLTVWLVEALTFGAALLCAWLLGASPAFALGSTRARLVAAARNAAAFRVATRLPRLLAELAALPYVFRAVGSRPMENRATFVKDRASQSAALLAVLVLTIRACNRTLLAGTSEPAAAILAAALSRAAQPFIGPLGFLEPLAIAIGAAAHRAWELLLLLATRLVAIDAAARCTPINAAFYALSDLERYLETPFKLVLAALGAFVDEVVRPLLRTLGLLTVNTLG